VTQTTVAIVGGGLAGLRAARGLNEAGIDFVLFEARDRLGGRILTVDATGQPCEDGFDLGPSWFWPRAQPAMQTLVAELGLAAFCQASDGDVMFERMSREAPLRYRATGGDPASMRLVGGTGVLVQALARDLPREKILLGTRVSELALTSAGVALRVTRGSAPAEIFTARKAILAVPPRLLEATISFSPNLDPATARLWRETPTWMAPTAKFVALFDHAFWRDAGLSGTAQSLVGPLAEMHDASTASGRAALFGFLGVGADQRAIHGPKALEQACLVQLGRIFGPKALAPSATLFKDWTADALTATDRDRGAASHIDARPVPWLAPPWRERLALAASETSASEPGYLAGAVDAAQRAVADMLGDIFNGQHGRPLQ